MREALCGMSGANYIGDLCVIMAVVPLSLAVGLLVRPLAINLARMFDQDLAAAGFFAVERHAEARDERHLRSLMRSMAREELVASKLQGRVQTFDRAYPRLRFAGNIVLNAIPFAFVLLMAPWGVTVNTRLTWLCIALVVLLAVALGLALLEYWHRMLAEEMRLLGMEPAEYHAFSMIDYGGPREAGLRGRHGPLGDIIGTDLYLGFHSVAGMAVMVPLVLTPSLYAWFNIAGSWDPYANTGQLEVAVANEDAGCQGELLSMEANMGQAVVAQLRANDSFRWVFVDREQAISGVEDGSYYAAIWIPENFSSEMMGSLVTGGERPWLTYYTNEKKNPIAPIITQKGRVSHFGRQPCYALLKSS